MSKKVIKISAFSVLGFGFFVGFDFDFFFSLTIPTAFCFKIIIKIHTRFVYHAVIDSVQAEKESPQKKQFLRCAKCL